MSHESLTNPINCLTQVLMRRLDESDDAAGDLEIHISRLPRRLYVHDHWRMHLQSACEAEQVIILVAQTKENEFTAFAFESRCVVHLLPLLEEKYPTSLDELVFFLSDDMERAIGILTSKHGIAPRLHATGESAAAARDGAAKLAELGGDSVIVGIRNEVINEMVAVIAHAGAGRYFMADFDDRSTMLKGLCQQAGVKLTSNEEYYILSL